MNNEEKRLEDTCASDVCAYRGTGTCSFKGGEYCPMYVECKTDAGTESKTPKAPEERTAKPKPKTPKKTTKQEKSAQLSREKVTVFATVDEGMVKAINEAASKCGHTLVRLDEKVIDDFLAARNAPTPEQTEVEQMKGFVNDPQNRSKAESEAKRLWEYLTNNSPIEEAGNPNAVFTRKDIIRRTTLSNKKARELLSLLVTFGFVRLTGGTIDEFVFQFRAEEIHRTVRRECMALMTEVARDFARYKALLAQDGALDSKARTQELSALKAEFRALLG